MRAIDTVLFDLDDTLHDDTTAYRSAARSVAEAIARTRGIDAAALAAAYDRAAMGFWSSLSTASLVTPIEDERERMWLEAPARWVWTTASWRGPPPPATSRRAPASWRSRRARSIC